MVCRNMHTNRRYLAQQRHYVVLVSGVAPSPNTTVVCYILQELLALEVDATQSFVSLPCAISYYVGARTQLLLVFTFLD